MRFTADELRVIKTTIDRSGLLKSFDGRTDLRILMQEVIDDMLSMHEEIQTLSDEKNSLQDRLNRLVNPDAYHDGF